VTDFGLSRSAEYGIYKQSSNAAPIPYRWAAPEVLQFGIYSSKVQLTLHAELFKSVQMKSTSHY
jgi:hypothetical protein